MQRSRKQITINWKAVMMVVLAIIIGTTAFLLGLSERAISLAEQGENVQELIENLQEGNSFYVEPENWPESIAMTRAINRYNGKCESEEERYTAYEVTDNRFLVTNILNIKRADAKEY